MHLRASAVSVLAVLAPAVLALAACSSTPPNSPPQNAACERQAEDDPALRQYLGIAAGNLDWQWQHEGEIKQARQDAVTRCLRARGLAPKGGVERPR